jgi:T5SS/PEP-CTERM-associated repeat protein
MVVLLMSLWAGIQPAAGQYTSNYQTNTISGAASYWPGDYVVGSNTLADALQIMNSGVLSNADGYVGYLPASMSNSVMVAGAGSVWTNANLFLGYFGGANTLTISNAGRVANSQLIYIANDAASSNNRALVTGTNSVWDCANNLMLGVSGFGNSLVVTNGGRVNDVSGTLGYQPTSSGNSALVTGAGSLWNNTFMCTVGSSGSNNKLTINKGGHMVCNNATIGTWGGANSNSVLVSDSGSLWDDSAEASVISFGANGSGNSLIVTNGGQMLGYYIYFGRLPSADNNSALVTGPGSSLSVNCYIYTGNQGHNNSFTLAKGATVSDKFCYISYAAGSANNSVLLADPNTYWQNSYSVFVGFDGGGGSLTISNGATMSTGGAFGVSHDGALGVDATSSNNRALITGSGSVLNCADNVYVGLNGPGNNLVINNGGRVMDTTGYVGSNPGSDNNRALVAGTHSVWTNSADMYVGDFSVGNSLMISNGGWVFNGDGYLGRATGSDSNSVVVTGAGSVWTNSSYVYVGCYGAGNSLTIDNGGRVSDGTCLIGYDANSFNNQALVTGTGSVLSNITATFVGYFGSSNNLVINNGGQVGDYWGLIGEEDSSGDNTVRVETDGVWRNEQLCVGDYGSHNAMFVDGGSVFVTTYMAVGFDPIYYDNLVQLNTGQIIVTNRTHDAELEVYGGGFLLAGGTLIVDTLVITNDGAQFMHIGGTLVYRNLQLDPAQDTDGDVMPNGWEQAHGLDSLNPDDANADADGDGMSNLPEYLAGTNPTNAASCFKITSMALTNGNVRVRWSAVGGKSYVLQTNSILGSAFADASPVIVVPGTGEAVADYLDLGAATVGKTRYYRMRLAP